MDHSAQRPVPAFRLGVVGNRDLYDADTAAIQATVSRFVAALKRAIDTSIAECAAELSPSPYSTESPRLFLIDSLAEGADQVVAKAVTGSEVGFRLRVPIPFDADAYKGFFSVDEQASAATFDDLTRDPDNGTVIVELHLATGERDSAYSAAADILLENSDLLLAVYDPSRDGSKGGAAHSVEKALQTGLPVVVLDPRTPEALVALTEPGDEAPLTSTKLEGIVSRIISPSYLKQPETSSHDPDDQLDRLRSFLREPLLVGNDFKRAWLRLVSAFYGLFWSAIPAIGSVLGNLHSRSHQPSEDAGTEFGEEDERTATLIDEIRRPYLDRMAPVDALAGHYMSLYRGSFVMNFLLGASAVLFGLLSYFNYPNETLWFGLEVAALAVILANYIGARLWHWHRRALDYRFIAEHLRHMAALAPLGRSAPLVRPAPQYAGHDPAGTWMGWYLRACDRDQGLLELESGSVPAVLEMDRRFLSSARWRLCNEWLGGQIRYHQRVERRFEGALTVFRGFMLVLFAITAVVVATHYDVELDPSRWRPRAFLTIVIAALPALLGALHGIAVQGELEVIALRASHMARHLRAADERMTRQAHAEPKGALLLSDAAIASARVMLDEVLDWRIIQEAHDVELT